MATFNGIPIFGSAVEMLTVENPREEQLNAFFGLSGLESLDGGGRGGVTQVKGILGGLGAAGLGGAWSLFANFQDGQSYTLVDTLGTAWPDVKLRTFRPTSRIRTTDAGFMFRSYEAEFFHLS